MQSSESHWGPWLALRMVRGIGNILGRALVRTFGDPRVVLAATQHALECAGVRPDLAHSIRHFNRWAEVERQLKRLDSWRGRLITFDDESYPEALRQVHDAPLFLFANGEITSKDALAVAVVGSRSASSYGRQMTLRLSEGLVRYGITVVSGLARGIDAQAHAAALRAGGRTIAVLGCGIDVNYPSEHHQLRMRISEQGAVVSEFLMGTQPDAENFPARNRIISGMTLGTVVVEANEKSGSLITASFALDQGREVFAVPGPVGGRSAGAHALLRQGATLVESAEDVVLEIAPHLLRAARPRVAPALEGNDARVFGSIGDLAVHVDHIIATTGLAAPTVLESLLRLELSGMVHQLAGQNYIRYADGSVGGKAAS